MSLKISLSASDPLSLAADVVVLAVEEGASTKRGSLATLAKALGPVVERTIKREEFTGKKEQTLELAGGDKAKAPRVILLGLGSGPLTDVHVRNMAAKLARLTQSSRASSVVFELPANVPGAERAAAEGFVLGAYRFTKYLTGDRLPKTSLTQVTLTSAKGAAKAAKDAVALGQKIGEAVSRARDLINEPPNELHPEAFAKYCVAAAKQHGLKCTVMDKPALARKGMNLLLAVAQGSARDPRVIHLTYSPAKKNPHRKRIVFVGKGLTFDTGGICIKPAPGMEDMKGDMGGGANVLGLMVALAALQPDVEVHGLIGAVENMPDGNAYRPGDIFKSLDGKTVEIINTDAEGRLVLADVLAYGRELKPDLLIDNATLTGAVVVALGTMTSGFYATNDELVERMKSASKDSGESMWHLPLLDELRDGLKSDWADLKHTADRWGGSITAALFLREFVGDVPWIHVDVAGPSLAHKPWGIYPKGGTGHGVLAFLKLVEQFAAK